MNTKLFSVIEKYDYISLDVFDTLITRRLKKPSSLFDYIEIALYQKGIEIKNFRKKRCIAEQKAIQNKSKEDITFDEIYENFNLDKSIKEEAKQAEIDAELFFCKKNNDFDAFLNQCKEKKKKIIITSDMYLPSKVIGKILEKSSISYDYIYVSSEIGLRKSTSNLFKFILKDLNIKKTQIVHIGDNLISDYLRPIGIGIHAKRYERKCNKIVNDKLDAYMQEYPFSNVYEKIGFQNFGKLLFGFCSWIHGKKNEESFDNLLFLARDGYIVQKAYEILYPEDKSSYVILSRRSLTVPLLSAAESMEDIVKIVPYIKRNETWKILLHKLGIENEEPVLFFNRKYGEYVKKQDLLQNEKYKDVFLELQPLIYAIAKKEKEEVRKYTDTFFLGKKNLVVDIGWYGTIQQSLEKFYSKEDTSITGLYLGLLERNISMNKRYGYVYDYQTHNVYNPKLIFGFNGLIENFFTANHGSAKKYKNACPVLEEWEKQNWPIISKVHEGALSYCMQVKNLIDHYSIKISAKEAFDKLHNLMVFPTKSDVDCLSKIVFYDAYYEPIVKYRGLAHYLVHPNTILKDFLSSDWKIGFLKKLFIFSEGLPSKIYLFMMKIK